MRMNDSDTSPPFHLNKQDDETFALTCRDTYRDYPYEIERSDDGHSLYEKKWAYDEESDNFEVYEVTVVKKYKAG